MGKTRENPQENADIIIDGVDDHCKNVFHNIKEKMRYAQILSTSKCECKHAISHYLSYRDDKQLPIITKYFLDCSPCSQDKIIDHLALKRAFIASKLKHNQHHIDRHKTSIFCMFSDRLTKSERQVALQALHTRISDLKRDLEAQMVNKPASPHLATV